MEMKEAVELPDKEDQNEWIAINLIEFFNEINELYGSIQGKCTEESCPVMAGGPNHQYDWENEEKVPAKKYIAKLLQEIKKTLENN